MMEFYLVSSFSFRQGIYIEFYVIVHMVLLSVIVFSHTCMIPYDICIALIMI